jgi:hypothetical protein
MNGIEVTRRIVLSGVESRVLILTTFDLDEYVYETLRMGASGFLLKDVTAAQLVEGVRVVAAGEAMLAPTVTRRLLEGFAALEHLPQAPRPRPRPGRDRGLRRRPGPARDPSRAAERLADSYERRGARPGTQRSDDRQSRPVHEVRRQRRT